MIRHKRRFFRRHPRNIWCSVSRVDPRPSAPILLVDDEPANLLALEAVLQVLGEPLVLASSGEEALRRLRDGDYAAVLLDVHMPSMDGFETARLIRAQRRSRATPIIFITADSSDLSVEEAYAMGAVDFLTKPLVPAVLKAKISFFVELHRSKQELQAAERQAVQDRVFLSAVLEAVEDGIVACDEHGTLTLFNRATREFHGMNARAVPSQRWSAEYNLFQVDGVTPLAKEQIPLVRALSGEEVRDAPMVIAPAGGRARLVLASGQPLYDDAGQKLGAVVSMHDVTVQKEAEAARAAAASEQIRREEAEAAAELIRQSREQLRASEERVRLATDAAGLGVWVWDAVLDRVTWENERLYAIFGLPLAEEPISATRFLAEFIHPEDVERFREQMSQALKGIGRLNFQGRIIRRNDGAVRWIEATGVAQPAADNSTRRILGTVADVTERKRAEDELRSSEERYRTLFESMDEGFCIIEMLYDQAGRPIDYRFLEVNPAFAKHTGMLEPAGKRMREMVPDHDQHWFDTYGRVAATGESVRFESEARAMGRWFDVYATRLGAAGTAKVAVLFNDITERRRHDDDLRRLALELAESDRRKTEFLATLAHELRNPLAPISNGLQLMRMAAGNAEAQERARNMMERQLKHMVHLVDDLLDIARISSNKVELRREQLDLRTVLASAIETSMPLVTAGSHHLESHISGDALQVSGDATRLAQVVSNLLNNAARYTPNGGRIELSADRQGDQAVIVVRDNGIGIDEKALPNVFEMFTQVGRDRDRSHGGLGIGLALVQRLVQLHGGSVQAHSAGVGRGSEFTVRLPLASVVAPAEAPAGSASAATHAHGGMRVLVVDDNADAAESLAALLEIEGHQTRVAHDGSQALHAARDFHPHVVFLDIGMPGKDGYEVARELRADAQTRDAVLVALTGWGAREDRARSRSAGFDHHLTKPASLSAVDELLAKLAEKRAEKSGPKPVAAA
jgi:PAS domain S-box-containing protein